MAGVVMADDGIAFDGVMAETAPLGGAETAFVALAEALAARGHRVEARNRCRAASAAPRSLTKGFVGRRSRATSHTLATSISATAATGLSGLSAAQGAACCGCTTPPST